MRIRCSSGLQPFVYALLLAIPFSATASAQSPSSYVPWSWQVRPNNGTGREDFCPSTASILATFAAVNVLVSIIGLLAGNRQIISWMSFGFLDGENDKDTWFYMFMFPLCINLGSNALIAYLYEMTPGFGHRFTIWDLTLFYTTKPRLSWLVLVIFMNLDTARSKGSKYIRAAKAAVAAEIILQVMSSYYMGKTASFATKNGYYNHPKTAPADARAMYAGALLSLVAVFFTLLCLVYILFSDASIDTSFFAALLVGCTSWLGSWLFWGGFVHLEGNE